MDHRPLNTDRMRSAGYDERSEHLEIRFHNGETKTYRRVPLEVARRFFASPNPASFWEDRIAEEDPAVTGRTPVADDAQRTLDDLFGRGKKDG